MRIEIEQSCDGTIQALQGELQRMGIKVDRRTLVEAILEGTSAPMAYGMVIQHNMSEVGVRLP